MSNAHPLLRDSYRSARPALQAATDQGMSVDFAELQRVYGSTALKLQDTQTDLMDAALAEDGLPEDTPRSEPRILAALQADGRLPEGWPLRDDGTPVCWASKAGLRIPASVRRVREASTLQAVAEEVQDAYRSVSFHSKSTKYRGRNALHLDHAGSSSTVSGWGVVFPGARAPRRLMLGLTHPVERLIARSTPSVTLDPHRLVGSLVASAVGADDIAADLRAPDGYGMLADRLGVSRRDAKAGVLSIIYGADRSAPPLADDPRLSPLRAPLREDVSDVVKSLSSSPAWEGTPALARTLGRYLITEVLAKVGPNPGLVYATPNDGVVLRRNRVAPYLDALAESVQELGLGAVPRDLAMVW